MDSASHHLFTGAGLAEDQHVGIGLGHLADEAAYLLDPLPFTHQQAQQGLTLVMGLLTRMQGDERLTEVQMTGEGFIGKGRERDPDKVAVGQIGLNQREEGGTGKAASSSDKGRSVNSPTSTPCSGPEDSMATSRSLCATSCHGIPINESTVPNCWRRCASASTINTPISTISIPRDVLN